MPYFLKKTPYVASNLREQLKTNIEDGGMLSRFGDRDYSDATIAVKNQIKESEDKALLLAAEFNRHIYNIETLTLFNGDLRLSSLPELAKRPGGIISGGPGFATGYQTKNFVNNILNNFKDEQTYAAKQYEATKIEAYKTNKFTYGSTLNTGVIQDPLTESNNAGLYEKVQKDAYLREGRSNEEAVARAAKDRALYERIEGADGHGWMTFDTYRTLKFLENDWSNSQEDLYQKIIKGENIDPSEYKDVVFSTV